MRHAARLGSLRQAVALAALVLVWNSAVRAATVQDDDLASRFATTPETVPDRQLLVEVTVNGVDFGLQRVKVANGEITTDVRLSPETWGRPTSTTT